MARSHLALFLLALAGCGSEGAPPPLATAPPTVASAEPTQPTEPTEPPTTAPGATSDEGATSMDDTAADDTSSSERARPVAIDAAGWAERERRTFVLQGAARGDVSGLAIARDGTHVAVGSQSGFVTILDTETGEVRASERIARSNLVHFEIDLVGDQALVAWSDPGGGAGLALWRWRAGTRLDIAQTNDLQGEGLDSALSPRGDRFAMASHDALHVGATRSGRVTTRVESELAGRLTWPHASALVEEVSPRASARGLVRVFDARNLAELWSAPIDAMAIVRPAGDRVVLLDGTDVVVRALPGGDERARVAHGVTGANRVAVSREGDRVVVSSDAASAMITLADGSRTEIAAGRALWVSPRNVLVEADDGSVRRWVLDRARTGMQVAPPRAPPGEYEQTENHVEVDASGLLVSSRGDRVEIVRADGTRHEFANGGEHSVWAVAVDEARRGLAIGGRFGAQRWDAAGVRDTACRGDRSPFVVDWQADTLVGDASCHLATSRRPRGVEEPFAVSDDARFLVESDGTFVDRATSRRVPLDEVGELYCRGHDEGCDGAVTFGPRGAALVLELFNVDVDEDSLLVHETTTGRRLASLPYGAAFAFAPDGAWLTYARTRTLHVLDLAGPDHATRTLVPGVEDDEEYAPSEVVLAASPDGRSIAWTPGNRHRVHVVSVADGHDTADVTVGATVLELRWSASGSQLAIRTAHEIRIHDVGNDTASRTLRAAHGTLSVACSERVLRWIRDAPSGGFEVVDLGPCDPGEEVPRLLPGPHLVWTDEGIVRVRRLDDGAELVFRTMREADTRHHLAHDAEGHWWTDEAASEAASDTPVVPTWVRHGDGRGGETTPLDPSMRRDDLLARFFATR
jgi:hypothetical protein